jgi:hypothetical protein
MAMPLPRIPIPEMKIPGPSDTGNDNETSENGISGVWMGFVVPYWQYTPVERYLTIYNVISPIKLVEDY